MASIGHVEVQPLVAKVKTLINAQLKTILKREGLAVSGVKSAMQGRIIQQIEQYRNTGNSEGFQRMKALVNNPDVALNTIPQTFHTNNLSHSAPPQHLMPNGSGRYLPPPPGSVMPSTAYAQVRPNFKDSPFFSIIEPLTPVMECKAINLANPVREAHRDTVECKISLKADVAERLNKDSALKVMVYCASEPISPFAKVDISFPHSVDMRVNLDEVKANLRGLKNKPGSTRPADITSLLRKRAGYDNTMSTIYALTNKKFYIVVNLVQQHSPEVLVANLKKTGKSISKEMVIREMISKAQDNEIVATSSIMSLKCPLSTLRIDIPCRSTICTHNQCFDALSFLQLQEQAPTWTCPVCNKIVSFEALEVDQYVNDILKSTPRSVAQVTIEPNGSWSQIVSADGASNPHDREDSESSIDEDDDLIEIQDMPRLAAIKDEAAPFQPSMTRTPPYSSREQSTGSIAPRSSNAKRPIGQVIDLTFSSDDEDQPPRGSKRHISQLEPMNMPLPYRSPESRPNGPSFGLPRIDSARPPGPPNYRY